MSGFPQLTMMPHGDAEIGTLAYDLAVWTLEPMCDRGGPGYFARAIDRIKRTSRPTLAAADAIRDCMRRNGRPLKPCQSCYLAAIALSAAEEATP